MSEEDSIDEPTEALLETDSDRDENEHARNFVAESMGLNVSIEFLHRRHFKLLPYYIVSNAQPIL